ncbi:MAG: YlxR family protein [Desertimonas sp.]
MPERTCVGCRRRRPQAGLVRVVLTPDGHAVVSRTAPGRGAWLCARDAGIKPECLALGLRRHGFQRSWRRPVPPAAVAGLQRLGRAADPAAEHHDGTDEEQRLPANRQDGCANDDRVAGRRVPGNVPAHGKG